MKLVVLLVFYISISIGYSLSILTRHSGAKFYLWITNQVSQANQCLANQCLAVPVFGLTPLHLPPTFTLLL